MSTKWNLTDAGPLGPWNPERSEKKKITVKMAEWLLEHCNTYNRPLVNSSIQVVKEALLDGSWICNGEPIVFNSEGTLLDGQNRLWGIIEANLPMQAWVHFGIQEKDAFMTYDRGKPKTGASDLATLGEKNHKELSAILTMIYAYEQGIRGSSLSSSPKVNTRNLLACLEKHPDVRESARWVTCHRRTVHAPGRIVGFVHHMAGVSGNPKVVARRDEFFDRLADGVGLPEDSPILALRNRWYNMKTSIDTRTKRGKGTTGAYQCLWTLVRTWNAFLMGHSLGKIQMSFKDPEKRIPQDIPDIRSYFRKPSEKLDELQATA
jgi:hypothetical protein